MLNGTHETQATKEREIQHCVALLTKAIKFALFLDATLDCERSENMDCEELADEGPHYYIIEDEQQVLYNTGSEINT